MNCQESGKKNPTQRKPTNNFQSTKSTKSHDLQKASGGTNKNVLRLKSLHKIAKCERIDD